MKKKMQNQLDRNTEVMEECIKRANSAFNNTFYQKAGIDTGIRMKDADPAEIGRMAEALFNSVVPSASQKEATKRAVDMVDGALQALDSAKPEPIVARGFSTYPGGVWEGLKSQVGPPPAPASEASYKRCTFCGSYDELGQVVTFNGLLPICKKCVEKKEKGLPLLTYDLPPAPQEETAEEDEETEDEAPLKVVPEIKGEICHQCGRHCYNAIIMTRWCHGIKYVLCGKCLDRIHHALHVAANVG